MRKLVLLLLGVLFLCGQLLAQNRTITGKVTDANGVAVPNASIVVKGSTIGTTSSSDGSFSLSVPPSARILVVSSVGMKVIEAPIGNQAIVSIRLESADQSLDEVVVMGYSTIRKTNLTGSVSKVNAKDIADRPVLSFDQALTGKAAGVQINTSSGLVGDNVIIRVRGASSISNSSQPLIVLDGIPLTQGNQGQLYNPANALADLNPNDIESVEVLKDASASAIYGSRASAGVLLITTKKGKAGQTTLNYDTYLGFNEAGNKMNVLNGADYNTYVNRMRSNAGLSNIANYGDIDGDGQIDEVSTDWQDEVYRRGFVQNHQISLSGGNGKTTYYGSVSYNDYENYIKVNAQTRGAARLNVTSKVNDWLQIGFNTQYSRTKSNGLGSGTGGALSGIPFGPLTAFPNIPVKTADGEFYTGQGGNTIALNVPNPLAVQTLNFDVRDSRRYIGSAFGELQLYKGLKFKSQINLDYNNAFTDQFWNPDIGDGSSLGGVAQTVYSDRNTWSWFNTLNYNTMIGDDHSISALLGSEFTRRKSYFAYGYGIGLNDPDFTIVGSANYTTVGADNGIDGVDDGLASYFGGLNYAFRDKFLASFNFRADGYSGFGSANRFGYFPSGSLGWRISDEAFMQKVDFVNDLKLRASYGITGNSNIGYYPAVGTFAPAQYADLGALTLSNPGNSALRWERTAQFDVGFDARIFNSTSITFDYYRKETEDLILANPILATIGFPNNSITQNIGKLRNTGLELTIASTVLKRGDFNWDVNFNIAWAKNRVVATNDNGDDLFGGAGIARPGVDLGTYYLIRWNGVNPANGLPTFLDINGEVKQYDHSAATANRWTLLKGGTTTSAIAAADRVIHEGKTPYPKFFGGLTQTITYKSFDLNIDLQYAFGHYLFNQTLQTLMSYANNRNKSEFVKDAWTAAGQQTDVPRLYYGDNQWSQTSTRWLEKGDFLRIRNLQIGYSVPKALLPKINRLRVYVQAQNLATFTGYKGIDPEANANGNTNIGLGVDNIRAYLPRTIAFGVNLGL